MTEPIRVLVLCTHNSARSQIAEALLRHMGGTDFAVHSAGTEVTRVHPLAIRGLAERGISAEGLYSKHLEAFIGTPLDVVVTVCDNANESCPLFPGDPERIHWSIPDPSAVSGSDEERLNAFRGVLNDLERRLPPFIEAQRQKRCLKPRTSS